jgi:hypothetical protein
MSAKAAPKTFQQVRNFLYCTSAYLGLRKGLREQKENDARWNEYWSKKWADQAAKDVPQDHGHHGDIPAVVPQELHGLYKELVH